VGYNNLEMTEEKLQGMLVGLAVGDTLGMPLEFKERGSFQPIDDMIAGGPFNLSLGYWTDDTSMALCLADSILDKQGYDSYDVMERYAKWRDEGYRSSTGKCFDIGNQVSSAISQYKEQPVVTIDEKRVEAAGNGCIMRLAPVVIASLAAGNSLQATLSIAAASARETHYSVLAEKATALFAALLYKAVNAQSKHNVLEFDPQTETVDPTVLATLITAAEKSADELKPTGYVIDTLEVAVWAFITTDSFKEGALKAVNLGGDADTIGAVYGQLAGAYYGLSAIPSEWRGQLYEFEEIKQLADQLSHISKFQIIDTRFREDRLGGYGDPVQAIGFPNE
jgi:ADP-ribosyl-[dinitrogen reductase] hydrolase